MIYNYLLIYFFTPLFDALNCIKKDFLKKNFFIIACILVAVMVTVAIFNLQTLYTFVTLLISSTFLIVHWFISKDKYIGRLNIAYLIHLVSFFIVHGVLARLPILTYNDKENLGARLYTIPVEDTMYSPLVLLMNVNCMNG